MKTKYIIGLLLAVVLFAGCVTKSVTKDPVTGKTNTVYAADTRIAQYTDTAHQGLVAASTIVPTAAPYFTAADGALSGLAAILTAISVAMARSKNQHQAAADSLAQAIQSQGPPAVQNALKVASANNTIATVAQHLDNNAPVPG